ncbi:FAD-linked oxidoreductase-like protein [Mycena alexandri]|uniref:Proline dehydrogenase n=1 Tax=Mycena alexandri TaxID=1745969 RepID=A0AAD6S8A1_9AGAR|nr:FAD-linked oxidoreductase-like protein [Mycena alexandri]
MLRIARTTLRASQFPRTQGVRYASRTAPKLGRRIVLASGGAALGLAGLWASTIHADSVAAVSFSATSKPNRDESAIRSSFGTLVRTYVVYTMCSIPALVDNSPWLLKTLSSIPGINWIAERVVRATFFDQAFCSFVGGDSAAETLPLLHNLRSANTGALFAYSVEVDEDEAMAASGSKSSQHNPHKAIVDEMLHCIDVAADFEDGLVAKQTGRRTWVAVKITALLPDASALIRLSSHIISIRPPTLPPQVAFPGNPTSSDLDILYAPKPPNEILSDADLEMLRDLHADLELICTRAQARGVRIIVDAEYSWYQPALDALTLALMRRFNALQPEANGATQPLVYATFQAYLRRTPAHLVHALRDAKKHKYALGVKLVRGAYHTHETAAHKARTLGKTTLSISPDALPPVWEVKADTDASYDACAGLLLDAVAADAARGQPQAIGVLFGTHNWASCKKVLAGLKERGLAVLMPDSKLRVAERVGERVTFGQLYGMCENLTQYLANQTESSSPIVIKYVPYGALTEVMPYLSRRAIENKSVLGGGAAQAERKRAWDAIWQRIFG